MLDKAASKWEYCQMPHEDIARIVQAVQAVSNAQIADLGDISPETLIKLVSVVLQNFNSAAIADEGDGWVSSGDNPADMPLTTNQAAARLGMSRPFLIKLLDQGNIPFHRIGRDRRILLSDVNRFLGQRDEAKRQFKQSALAGSC